MPPRWSEIAKDDIFEESDWIPISALQHHTFCPRQCGLIHLDHIWDDNLYTLRGKRAHERVDDEGYQVVEGQRYERALPLWSQRHGLTGKADLVVFHADGTPYPVEFKSGRRAARLADRVQVAAQALCLEEMTSRVVPTGALYYRASRRRVEVVIDEGLRATVTSAVAAVRAMLSSGIAPPPVQDARCRDCSLAPACLPDALARLRAGDLP